MSDLKNLDCWFNVYYLHFQISPGIIHISILNRVLLFYLWLLLTRSSSFVITQQRWRWRSNTCWSFVDIIFSFQAQLHWALSCETDNSTSGSWCPLVPFGFALLILHFKGDLLHLLFITVCGLCTCTSSKIVFVTFYFCDKHMATADSVSSFSWINLSFVI